MGITLGAEDMRQARATLFMGDVRQGIANKWLDQVNTAAQTFTPPTPSDSLTNPVTQGGDHPAAPISGDRVAPAEQVSPAPVSAEQTYRQGAAQSWLQQVNDGLSSQQPATSPDVGAANPSAPATPSAEPAPEQTPVPPAAPTSAPSAPAAPATPPMTPTHADLVPDQFNSGLSYQDALAACGPVAAVALAKTYGNNIPVQAALDAAKAVGWTQAGGMNGVGNQKRLLDHFGIPTHLDTNPSEATIAQDAANGNPVTISTPNHYYVANDYNPQTGQFFVGQSGRVFKSGGGSWMTLAQIRAQGGGINGALFVDNPTTSTPSIAVQPGAPTAATGTSPGAPTSPIAVSGGAAPASPVGAPMPSIGSSASPGSPPPPSTPQGQNPLQGIGDALGGAADAVKSKAGDLTSFLSSLGREPSDQELSDYLLQQHQADNQANQQPSSAVGGAAQAVLGTPDNPSSGAINRAFTAFQGPLQDYYGQRGADEQRARQLMQQGTSISPADRDWLQNYYMNEAMAVAGTGDVNAGKAAAGLVKTGAEILEGALNRLGQYPADAVQAVKAAAFDAQAHGTAPSTVGAQIQRWMEANPLEKFTSQPETPPLTTPAAPRPNDPYFGGEPPVEPGQQFTRNPQGDIIPIQNQGTDTTLQGLINMAKSKGYDTSALEGQLHSGSAPAVEAPSNVAPPAAGTPDMFGGGGKPPVEPPTATAAPGEPPPQSTQSVGAQSVPPGFPKPINPASPLELFNAYHSGNVVSGAATLAHVAANTLIAPVWSGVTRTAADIVTLHFDRVAGRGVGTWAALSNAGSDFMGALAEHFANPNAVMNRVDNPALKFGLQAQAMLGGSLHAALQNVVQGAVQRMEYGALAGEKASAEGLTGPAFTARVGELIGDPSQLGSAAAMARDLAQRAALRAEGGNLQKAMVAFQKVPILGNTLFPVVRISSQALAQGLERSPLGLLGTAADVGAAKLFNAGPYKEGFNVAGGAVTPLANRLLNNVAGTAVAGFFVQKALDGTLTGNGPTDPGERALLVSQGWQPNSLYVPGLGYRDTHFFGPLSQPLAQAAAIGDAALYSKGDGSLLARASTAAESLGLHFTSTTGLQTIGELAQLLKGGAGAGKLAASFLGNVAGGFVPESGAVRSAALATDTGPAHKPELGPEPGEESLQTLGRGIGQTIGQNIPGLRGSTPTTQDVLGRNENNTNAGLGVLLPRGGGGTPSSVLAAFTRAGATIPPRATSVSMSGVQIPLTIAEQRQYEQQRGAIIQSAGERVIANPVFQRLSPDQQRIELAHVVAIADQSAHNQILASIPRTDLRQRFAEAQSLTAQRHMALPVPVGG